MAPLNVHFLSHWSQKNVGFIDYKRDRLCHVFMAMCVQNAHGVMRTGNGQVDLGLMLPKGKRLGRNSEQLQGWKWGMSVRTVLGGHWFDSSWEWKAVPFITINMCCAFHSRAGLSAFVHEPEFAP